MKKFRLILKFRNTNNSYLQYDYIFDNTVDLSRWENVTFTRYGPNKYSKSYTEFQKWLKTLNPEDWLEKTDGGDYSNY